MALYSGRAFPDFIFFSPERLATDGFLEHVLRRFREQIKLVVVDEAHCISQWGSDFRPFYKEIPYFLHAIFDPKPLPVFLGLTATLNPTDRDQMCLDFGIEPKHVIRSEMLLRPEIDIQISKVPDEDTKDVQFWELMERHRADKVLVYVERVRGKRSSEELAEEAKRRGFRTAHFHGEMESDKKIAVLHQFKAGDLLTVFATSAFGMGIDIPDIRGVVHYTLTESVEQYYQQIGRAGRDRKPCWAVLFYSDKNIDVRKSHFIERSFPKEEEIRSAFAALTDGRTGLRTVQYFMESEETQRAYHYFLRSHAIHYVCKGISSLDVLQPKRGVSLPDFETYRNATKTGQLLTTTRKLEKPVEQILDDVYSWLANGKLQTERAPVKCLIIDTLVEALPDSLLAQILEDIERKKQHRHAVFAQFVELLGSYRDSMNFHKQIGERLGIDRFGCGRIHQTLSGDVVRSKSEVIVANILYQSGIPFQYEKPLFAPDRSWRLPDFTIDWQGYEHYWEHLGMLDRDDYAEDWAIKEVWYRQHFPGQLITTKESSTLSREAEQIIAERFQQIRTGIENDR